MAILEPLFLSSQGINAKLSSSTEMQNVHKFAPYAYGNNSLGPSVVLSSNNTDTLMSGQPFIDTYMKPGDALTGRRHSAGTIVWTGSQYIVLSGGGAASHQKPTAATSANGITWTRQQGLTLSDFGELTLLGRPAYIQAAAWSPELNLLVGAGSEARLATSTDGITWNVYTTELSNAIKGTVNEDTFRRAVDIVDIVWTGTQFVLIAGMPTDLGPGVPRYRIATSSDGINWTDRTASFTNNVGPSGWPSFAAFTSLVWTGTQLVAGARAAHIATSPDGITWTYRAGLKNTNFGGAAVSAMVWTGTQLVAGGSSAEIATSPDGITWTYRAGLKNTNSFNIVESIAWSPSLNRLVAVGPGARVATSPDGITWTYRAGLSSTDFGANNIFNVGWNGSQFIVGGEFAKIATSPDGITWTYRTGLEDVAFGAAPEQDTPNTSIVVTEYNNIHFNYNQSLLPTGDVNAIQYPLYLYNAIGDADTHLRTMSRQDFIDTFVTPALEKMAAPGANNFWASSITPAQQGTYCLVEIDNFLNYFSGPYTVNGEEVQVAPIGTTQSITAALDKVSLVPFNANNIPYDTNIQTEIKTLLILGRVNYPVNSYDVYDPAGDVVNLPLYYNNGNILQHTPESWANLLGPFLRHYLATPGTGYYTEYNLSGVGNQKGQKYMDYRYDSSIFAEKYDPNETDTNKSLIVQKIPSGESVPISEHEKALYINRVN